MSEDYTPPSAFLQDILADNIPLGGSIFGDANLRRLIGLTRDADPANRDWATMLLGHVECDTAEVREALLAAAGDEDIYVRGEAISALAQRDPAAALPLIHAALREEFVCLQVFEAAAAAAHPSLVEPLRGFTDGEDHVDEEAHKAFAACVRAAQAEGSERNGSSAD